MELQHQVIKLQTAKRLKQLGVNVTSLFWHHRMDNGTYRIHPYSAPGYSLQGIEKNKRDYQAYTVAELGIMLTGNERAETTIWDKKEHLASYNGKLIGSFTTEAESRGAMLTHLLESGIVDAEEVNANFKNYQS